MAQVINNKKRIVIAMSGGGDSTVAATLLKKAGFDVIGIHMKFWSEGKTPAVESRRARFTTGQEIGNRCCSPESEKMARLAAKKIGIPFYVLHFGKEFKKLVVDYFLMENLRGRTPNPCVACNREIKFGLLIEKAKALGAEYVATGHYAIVKNQKGRFLLKKGKDKDKDQSYFLWQLNQNKLAHILFPVGQYKKEEIKKMAREFNLPNAETPESQEICFVKTNVNDFLKKYLGSLSGKIIDEKGNVLGKHDGLYNYTIGQRKGIGLAGSPSFARFQRASAGNPYYVLNKDAINNILIVTKDEKKLERKELIAKNINWISGSIPKLPMKITAKIRYRNIGSAALIKRENKEIKIKFQKPQRAIASGQSVVFYKGQELLGGGIID